MAKVCVEFDAGTGTPSGPQLVRYGTTIGTGTQTEFTVDHNLGVRPAFVAAHDLATGELRNDYSVHLINGERAVLRFDTAPLANGTHVEVIGAKLPSMGE